MTSQAAEAATRAFVEEVLRTGLMLSDLLGGLLDDLPADAFPGENPGEVLLEMLVGTVLPVTKAAGIDSVQQATTLLGATADRTLLDLRAALDQRRDR